MDYLSSVHNSCRLLMLFLDSSKELGVSEISRKLGLSKGGVHKLLSTLESQGFIRQNPDNKQYALGYTLLELGNQVLKNHNLVEFARPYMSDLSEKTQELVCLCQMDSQDAIYVHKLDSQHPIRFNVEMFRRFPLYATSAARVILAFQPEEVIEQVLAQGMKSYTPYTNTNAEDMRIRLAAIRDRGVEISSNQRNVGVTGIAAPIREANGQITASISVIGPSDRMAPMIEQTVQLVREITANLSAGLGYRA